VNVGQESETPMTPKSSDYGRVFFQAEVFRAARLAERRPRPSDTVIERARRVPVFRDCDVLVAGGGPSGTAAAIAAARAGADTVLVERHQPSWRAVDGRPCDLDRPHDRLVRPACHRRPARRRPAHLVRCDEPLAFLREIPQCWLTGQAAGAAAAPSAAEKCEPRAVSTAALQALLLGRGSCCGGRARRLQRRND
jgi:hypothetical protein